MCGIVGFFARDPEASRLSANIHGSISSLKHRGPDDTGLEMDIVCGGVLALAQTRLSIIDLSSAGHQPMSSSDGRYKIIFNGEIYNYRELRDELIVAGHTFATATDTEVLLLAWKHWGEESLGKLRGMFAFVIVDFYQNILYCVRDPFGIKPFYFYSGAEGFVFASEPRALMLMLNRPAIVNRNRMRQYLEAGAYDDDDQTFYADVHQLRPGQMIRKKLENKNKVTPESWYRAVSSERLEVSFEKAVRDVRELFLESVRLHLRSDVPLGAALSGGIDSSSVVCALRYLNPRLKINTFSYVARGSPVDEEKWIDMVNAHADAIPHKIFFKSLDIIEDLDNLILTQGEPMGGPSFYAEYRVYQLARESGIKVMLDGHGADEVFAGYAGYPLYRAASLLDEGKYYHAISFLNSWSKWPGRGKWAGVRAMLGAIYAKNFNNEPHAALRRYTTRILISSKLYKNKDFTDGIMPSARAAHTVGKRLSEKLRKELSETSCPPQLRCADRSAMRQSIENRVPFLHKDLVEYTLRLPESYLVSDLGVTKSVFRHAMHGIVPLEVLNRRDKIGYAVPGGGKVRNQSSLVRSVSTACERFPSLNRKNITKIITNGDEASVRLDALSWRLINFLRWSEIFDVSEN